ncbi:MAG: phosphatase PAP2 family protein [Sphingomonadaceae bacterium]
MKQRRYALHLAVFGVAAIVFGAIALGVIANEPAATLDRTALAWAHAHAAPFLTTMMLGLSLSGGPSATSVYASVLIVAFLSARWVREAVAIAAIIYGGMLLNVVVKHAFGRARPTVEHPVIALATYSFPSGHAAASTIFGGLLGILALRSAAREAHKAFALLAAILWIGAVCTSRVYLGVHYLTDVLGGVAEGIAWLALSTLLLDIRGTSVHRAPR